MQSDFELLKTQVLSTINIKQITPSNIINLIVRTMHVIDKSRLHGGDKKQMCINIVYSIVESSDSIVDKDFIFKILDSLINTSIENIIDVSNGKISINKKTILSKLLKLIKKCKCIKL